MKRPLLIALFGSLCLTFFCVMGWMSSARNYFKARAYIEAQDKAARDVIQGLGIERDQARAEAERARQFVRVQLVNNEEILAAARQGHVAHALKKREKILKAEPWKVKP